jgi:hypothetical protein
MKNLSTILASVSLALNAAFGVGAFVVYVKAKAEAKVQAAIDEKKAEATEALKSRLPIKLF